MRAICHHIMSLDGFIAGPDDSMDWASAMAKRPLWPLKRWTRIGAILAGRRWYELAIERWNGVDGIYCRAYDGRVFVLTHRPPDDGDDARISFISDGIRRPSQRRSRLVADFEDDLPPGVSGLA
jgi:dihydrofolate reductase